MYKQNALEVKALINQTDKEIDQMVYQLYGITEEEIEIVENSWVWSVGWLVVIEMKDVWTVIFVIEWLRRESSLNTS